MRRFILIALLGLLLGLVPAPSAGATFYLGGGKGIRVAFRLKEHKLIQAEVVARLYCVGPHSKRHFSRIKFNYAFPEDPLRLDRLGRFRYDTRGLSQEEGFRLEEFIGGQVSGGSITGRYEYFRAGGSRHMDCRTGSFPRTYGETASRFVARRQVAGS